MYNITLVGSRHIENGKCNSDELYKIIESLNPEVVFEEIRPSSYNAYYVDKIKDSLETRAIIKYRENHQLKQILVDCEDEEPPYYLEIYVSMLEEIEKNSINYQKGNQENDRLIDQYGFGYLNSVNFIEFNDWLTNEREETLRVINDEKLSSIYQMWYENNINNRENIMIKNIYDYCKNHSFERGLFCIGAAHRSAIKEKTQKYNETSELKLNWDYLDYGKIEVI
jgi:hypothetical protein